MARAEEGAHGSDRTRARRRRRRRPRVSRRRARRARRRDRLGRARCRGDRRHVGRITRRRVAAAPAFAPPTSPRAAGDEPLSEQGRRLTGTRPRPRRDTCRRSRRAPAPARPPRDVGAGRRSRAPRCNPGSARPARVAAAMLPAGRISTELVAADCARCSPAGPTAHSGSTRSSSTRGRRVTFGRDAVARTTDVATAVAASCAIPSFFAPVIDRRRSLRRRRCPLPDQRRPRCRTGARPRRDQLADVGRAHRACDSRPISPPGGCRASPSRAKSRRVRQRRHAGDHVPTHPRRPRGDGPERDGPVARGRRHASGSRIDRGDRLARGRRSRPGGDPYAVVASASLSSSVIPASTPLHSTADVGRGVVVAGDAVVQHPVVREDRDADADAARERHERERLEHRPAARVQLRTAGPGTFVVTVLTLRCGIRIATRVPSASSIDGANPDSDVSTSPATACFDSLSPSICARIAARRSAGSSSPTGSSAIIADTRLLYVPRSPVVRTDTGTSVRTTRPSTLSSRASSRVAETAREHGEHDVVDGAAEPRAARS